MALVPSKRWTVIDVLSMVREITKTVDQNKVLVDQGRYFYNTALSEIVTLLNGASDPSYFYSEPLALAADIAGFVTDNEHDTHSSMITNINITTNVVTLNGADDWVIGDLLFFHIVDGDRVYDWTGRIISVTNNGSDSFGTYSLIEGSAIAYVTGHATRFGGVIRMKGYSSSVATLADLSYPVDRIVTIHDSVYGQCIPVTLDEFYSIGRPGFEHKSYDNDIVYTTTGSFVYFRNGSKCTTPGTKTVIYQRQPVYPTLYDNTEYVDLADKWIPLLVKRIYTYLMLQIQNDIPKNLANEMAIDYQQISAFAGAEISNRQPNTRENK